MPTGMPLGDMVNASFFTVTNSQPSYKYCVPLVYVEPIAELLAVDTPPIKNPARHEIGHSDWDFLLP